MTRRIYRTKFAFYILWIAIPFFIGGLLLAFYPAPVLPYLQPDSGILTGNLKMAVRILGILFLYTGMTLIFMRGEPDKNRELAFWQALLCLGLGGLFAASPWLFGVSYWILLAALYLLGSGAFLFTFASRNLLVRE